MHLATMESLADFETDNPLSHETIYSRIHKIFQYTFFSQYCNALPQNNLKSKHVGKQYAPETYTIYDEISNKQYITISVHQTVYATIQGLLGDRIKP